MPSFISLYIALILSSIPVSFQQDQFIFNGYSGPNTNITLSGSAEFHGNGSIQLTNYSTNLIGQVFHTFPLQFKNSTNGSASSFSTSFAFSISHTGSPDSTSGDGLAFFVARSTNFSYAHWGSQLGLFNPSGQVENFENRLLAVEFDTYQNDPFQDINDNHVGIDINSLFSVVSEPAAYFDDDSRRSNITLRGGQPIMAWIEYDSVTNFLSVTLSLTSTKPRMPLLSLRRDLSSILEESMYVGFSASTGGGPNYAQNVLGWSFSMNGEAEPLNLSYFPSISPRTERKNRTALVVGISIGAFLLVLILVVMVFFLTRKVKNTAKLTESGESEIGPDVNKYLERGVKDSELDEKEKISVI